MAINETASRREFERRFFLGIAILFVITAFIGFAPTYYLKSFFSGPPVARTIIHLHAFLMSSWVILFVAQIYFIRSTRVRLHQKLGYLSIGLAIAIVVAGLITAVAAAKYGSVTMPPGATPLEFMIVPFFDMVVFPVLFGAAIYYHRNAPNHKRLMLLTVVNFTPPALARFPFGLTAMFGPLWFFGVPDALALIFVVVDTWRNRKLNVVFLVGTIFMIAMHWVRLPLSTTETWHSFAIWVTNL